MGEEIWTRNKVLQRGNSISKESNEGIGHTKITERRGSY